jgi:hypothetical protein
MSLRHGVLSLLLFLFVILLGLKNYEIWTLPIELVPEKGETKKSGAKADSPPSVGDKREPAPIESYIFIAEKNIFTPERKDFPVTAPPPGPEVKKPIVRPQIILYGVTIVGDYQSAFIANPGRALRKGEREIMTVKVGDPIGEYKLTKVFSDRIALEAPGDNFEVLLYDSKMPKRRTYAKTENRPANVTNALTSIPPIPAPTTAGALQPTPPGVGRPEEPISGQMVEAPMPRAVTAGPTPSRRTRTWYGPRSPEEEGLRAPAEN